MDIPIIVISITAAALITLSVTGLFLRHWMQKQAAAQQDLLQKWQSTFESLAGDALLNNSQNFLALAKENFKVLHREADASLQQREQAVENLVKPIREALEKATRQIQEIEKDREGAYGSLAKQLELTARDQNKLRMETQRLVQALKQPQVRGRWGEITLHRLVELAGMVEYCDFYQQESISDAAGNTLRPDVIVRMPNERVVVIDAKTSIAPYLAALETSQENEQKNLLEKHAQNIYERVKELSAKSYGHQFDHALDFVVLFVPGDQFLDAALKHKPDLIDQALAREVILATPTSLIALLRVIAFGWRERSLAENAHEIQQLSGQLCDRFKIFSDHLEEVGKGINSSVKKYNTAVRSFESRLMPSARKLREFGIAKAEGITSPSKIDTVAITAALPHGHNHRNDKEN